MSGRRLFGDVAFVFDGEVGDATAGVEGAIGENGIGWTGLDATRTGAAVVGDEGNVWFEFEAEQDFGKEKIGAFLRMDEAGVLADPAEAGALGEVAFEEGAGIGVVAIRDGMSDLRFDELDEAGEARREDEVVVFAEGVGGDPPSALRATPPKFSEFWGRR